MQHASPETLDDLIESALPPLEVCRQARLSRDSRFDGHFFIGVLSTGVYCRPICPARTPNEANVRYYPSAAAASEAGYRPCLRCRPEAAPSRPEWSLASDTVLRGLRMIEAGYLNDNGAAALAESLGVSERHLSRLFAQELGAAPRTIAGLCRANLARNLLLGTSLNHAEVAHHAGFGSLSRFNHEIRRIFQCSPSQLRSRSKSRMPAVVTLHLPVGQPYDFDWVFVYLSRRALVGVEEVTGEPGAWRFRRRLHAPQNAVEDEAWVQVDQADDGLCVTFPLGHEPLYQLLQRVRRVFDLQADGSVIHEFLAEQDELAAWVTQAPGLRVVGAWDGYETAVRAVLGQQVSVQRGTELANRMMASYGNGAFPAPEQLVHRDVAELGMRGRRGRAIARLAQLVADGLLVVDEFVDADDLQRQLQSIDGIGPWTANYIRMRAGKDPDAFPDNDWVVLKQLGSTAAQARRTAEAWRPWRAYALMYLWYAAGQRRAAG